MPRRLALAAGAALAALLVGARPLVEPGLLGSPGGEVYAHAWVQWWTGEALPRWPDGPGDLLAPRRAWTVIDPLPTLLAALAGRVLGVVVAYDALALGAVALAFAGGAALARRLDGDPWVGGLALALAPPFLGSLASGLTEDLAVGLSALALAALAPGARRPWMGGLLLGLLAWCGPVLAWATGLLAAVAAAGELVRDRRRLRPLALAALAAAAVALPAALRLGPRLRGVGHGFGALRRGVEPLWRLNPWQGADLLSFLAPGRVDPGDALVRTHPAWLGAVVVALAALAALRRPALRPLAAGAGLLALLSLGRELRAAGHPLGLPGLAALLPLPLSGLLHHYGRLLLGTSAALAGLAAAGAARLPPRWRRLAAPAVALDLALLSPLPPPLPVAPADPPGVVACALHPCLDDLPPGPLLVLPAAGPGIHFQRPLLDQRVHRRPLALDPNRPGLPRPPRTDTERWLAGLALPDRPPPPARFEPPEGVAVLLVLGPWVDEVAAVLGPPDARAPDSAAWALAARVSSPR